jgi:predicted alpha/beta superfamily hydrolase
MIKLLLHMILSPLVFNQMASSVSSSTESPQNSRASVVGNLKLHQFPSKIFDNVRTIRVLLPPGYEDTGNRGGRYPVLYLNDGQNLFDEATSVFNRLEWQVDETADRLAREEKIAPLIIVGIDNAGKGLRPNEYLPYEDKFLRPSLPSPEGKKYPQFLTEEVMPFINKTYRTRTDADSTGIGGSSYGAVAALYAVLTKPGRFGRLLLESPSLYISDGQLIRDSMNKKKWPLRIYIGVGTNEGGGADCKPGDWKREAVQDVLRFEQVLQAVGLDDKRLMVVVEDCARHDEAAWAKRFPNALQFLYGKK